MSRSKSISRTMKTLLIVSLVFFASCSKKETDSHPPFIMPSGKSNIVRAKKPAPVIYRYTGDRFRDFLFKPESGSEKKEKKEKPAKDYDRQMPFILEDVFLKGFLSSPPETFALLTDRDGNSFVLKNGKIYDLKKREVPGGKGLIKKKSVVLIYKNQLKELFVEKRS